jgi:predicted nicotinamide N-methyase
MGADQLQEEAAGKLLIHPQCAAYRKVKGKQQMDAAAAAAVAAVAVMVQGAAATLVLAAVAAVQLVDMRHHNQ